MSDQSLERALGFLRDFARRQAGRVVAVPGGFAVLDGRYPDSYVHNRLIISGRPEPCEILAMADTVLGGAGLGHRMVVIEDDRHGSACAEALSAAGYLHGTSELLRYPGDAGALRHDSTIAVTEADAADLADSTRREWRDRLPDAAEEVVTQLVERRSALVLGADRVEFLSVRDAEHQVVSRTDLYLHPAAGGPGSVAQIDDLATDPAHQGRGYAGAVLAEALRRAESASAELVFLVADADDWPQTWYRRLGFVPVGRFHEFVRPGTSSAFPSRP